MCNPIIIIKIHNKSFNFSFPFPEQRSVYICDNKCRKEPIAAMRIMWKPKRRKQ